MKTHFCRVVIFTLLVAAIVNTAQAQEQVTDGTTPVGLKPGAPAGSYALSDFENVNLFNGNLNFARKRQPENTRAALLLWQRARLVFRSTYSVFIVEGWT